METLGDIVAVRGYIGRINPKINRLIPASGSIF